MVPTPRRPLCDVSRTSSAARHFGRRPGWVKCSHTVGRGAAMSNSITAAAASRVTCCICRSFSCCHAASRSRTQHVTSPMMSIDSRCSTRPCADRIDAHGLDAGVGIQRVGVAAEALVHGVLQQAMNEDDVAAGEFLAARHLVLDELAVVADEFEVEILHPAAGVALAGGRLADVAKTLPEGEVGRLDGVLEHRSVDLVGDRVEEGRVALELGEPERRPQPPHHRVHHVGDDVLRVVELDPGEKAGVAGDVGDHETGGFGFRKHRAVPSS